MASSCPEACLVVWCQSVTTALHKMKLPRLNFTSYRDRKGYRIVGVVPPPQKEERDLERRLATPAGEIGRLKKGGDWISGRIVGKGGKMEPIELSHEPKAFEEFAKIKTPDELLNFTAKYGPLSKGRNAIIFLLDEARQMRECMRGKKGEPYSRTLTALLYKDRESGQLEISVTPTSLLDALWLQFQYSQSSDAVFKTCPYCKKPFAAGGNSGRLRNAEFCSPEHRKRFNSLARSNPALKEKRK
jgi:hypothetical protein